MRTKPIAAVSSNAAVKRLANGKDSTISPAVARTMIRVIWRVAAETSVFSSSVRFSRTCSARRVK